jgi:hypothetical protein
MEDPLISGLGFNKSNLYKNLQFQVYARAGFGLFLGMVQMFISKWVFFLAPLEHDVQSLMF